MKSHAQAVVIGGGVVGCSVLYHLTKAGWKDVVLLERDQLTCGSTWHAAGGFHTLNGDPNVAKLQAYTIDLYDELEAISGEKCGLHLTGGVALAEDKGFADGEMVLGDKNAPITVIEYASMTCPHCAHFHEQTYAAFKTKYIDTGQAKFIFREFPLDRLALAASILARCGMAFR